MKKKIWSVRTRAVNDGGNTEVDRAEGREQKLSIPQVLISFPLRMGIRAVVLLGE
jgi:hypothetical protein